MLIRKGCKQPAMMTGCGVCVLPQDGFGAVTEGAICARGPF